MRKKLTKTQKQKNAAKNKAVKRIYDRTDKAISFKKFKDRVVTKLAMEGKNYKDVTITEAKLVARKEANTRTFKTAEEQGRENLMKAMKKDFQYTWQSVRHEVGRLKKGETISKRIYYDENIDSWVLKGARNNYMIVTSNSPENISLVRI